MPMPKSNEIAPHPPSEGETYLGDGLYASFDGWQIKLRAPRGLRDDHEVYLEPAVWESLQRYAEKLP